MESSDETEVLPIMNFDCQEAIASQQKQQDLEDFNKFIASEQEQDLVADYDSICLYLMCKRDKEIKTVLLEPPNVVKAVINDNRNKSGVWSVLFLLTSWLFAVTFICHLRKM